MSNEGVAAARPRELRAPLGIVGTLLEHFVGVEWRVIDEERLSVGGGVPPPPPPVSAPMRACSSRRVISGEEAVGLFGGALAAGDFDHDGLVDLVVGSVGAGERGASPRAGSVRVLYGRGTVGELSGGGPLARFGSRVAVLDFNLDGIDDLAISAPGASGWNVSKAGASPYPFDETDDRHFGACTWCLKRDGVAGTPGADDHACLTGLGSAPRPATLMATVTMTFSRPGLAAMRVGSSLSPRTLRGARVSGSMWRRHPRRTLTCEAMATALRAGLARRSRRLARRS